MKRDFRKLLALLSETAQKPELPFPTEKRDIEIPFITKEGKVCRRFLRIYFPEGVPRPMPVVFIAHYEMTETDAQLFMYLKKGWAVSTPIHYSTEYNGQLIDDDLAFNSAALTAVRRQPDIDRHRMIVSGGSAGGYMTLMLSVLHLGICGAVSFSGITNMMFNMQYMKSVNSYNEKALAELGPEERKDVGRCLDAMTVPVLGAVSDQFMPILRKAEADPDSGIWSAASPACMTECFTNPVLFTHFTSDILVPVDQLTKRYTYGQTGGSLPEGFRIRLSEFSLDEKQRHSLAEMLPEDMLSERLIPAPDSKGEDVVIPFDSSKRFNIVVFDEGCVEADAGHQKNFEIGSYDATGYMEELFKKTSRETNWLSAGKLILLAERYAGMGVLLPGRPDTDDTAFGSLAAVREEILEELSDYAADHWDELKETFGAAKSRRPDAAGTLMQIYKALRGGEDREETKNADI